MIIEIIIPEKEQGTYFYMFYTVSDTFHPFTIYMLKYMLPEALICVRHSSRNYRKSVDEVVSAFGELVVWW